MKTIGRRSQSPARPTTARRRRQIGTDRHSGGAPVLPPRTGRGTIRSARFALFLTAIAGAGYLAEQIVRLARSPLSARVLTETTLYLILVVLLTGSATAYLLARLGHYQRAAQHRRVPRSTIDDQLEQRSPSVTVLVPSYREDQRVIDQTLMSAALQEYPGLRIVLLIDDPPRPGDREAAAALEAARTLPATLQELFDQPYRAHCEALARFDDRADRGRLARSEDLSTLADSYEEAAGWLQALDGRAPRVDHVDDFMADEVYGRLAADLTATAAALRHAACDPRALLSTQRVRQLHERLVDIFDVQFTSFERKLYASLSHEANKAMNLNSYLGLMGGRYRIESSPGGDVLLEAPDGIADLVVPDSDYVLTLDADSVLLPEYCLRLVHHLEQAENQRVAVVQTPYSAYRGAATRIERLAGATTDIQHIVHQGLTHFGATFWVGANAVIRKSALDDLLVETEEEGFVVRRYISDRTVIEDTESSIELRAQGWQLYNHPERLSYSATPPDFGSLVVQRKRWANGGLVILPQLLRWRRRAETGSKPSVTEVFLRTSYLSSISWASLGLLVLLFYPFEDQLLSRLAVVTALPYFIAMSTDLHRCGYRRSDILRVYGFNLLLLPVNLLGTMQSIVQAIGGQKMAFARTPKVKDRTVAPFAFVVIPYLLVFWSVVTLARDIESEAWVHGAFAAANALLGGYATLAFIGIRHTIVDVFVSMRDFVYRPVKRAEAEVEIPHWATVLYVGSALPEEVERSAPLAVALAAHDQQRRAARELAPPPLPATTSGNGVSIDLTSEDVEAVPAS